MRKAILASVILSSMFSVAQAADVKLGGDFGYRNDGMETTTSSNRDRLRLQLNASANVNDKAKVVFGLRTGSTKSSWNDLGDTNALKTIGLNLAYVEYAAAPFAKVTLGKMNRPWSSDALFFDNDIKPEGLAVALKHGSGLTASAFKLKLSEGGVAVDNDVVGAQVGYGKKILGLDVAASAAKLNQKVVSPTPQKLDQLVLNVSAKTKVVNVPVKAFVEQVTNNEAKTLNKAIACGVTLGEANKAGEWEVSVLKQKAEANALSSVWTDSDFGGEATEHNGTAIRAAYALADGWKVRGSFYDTTTGAQQSKYKRTLIDLTFAF